MPLTIEYLEQQKLKMFATQDSTEEAIEYAEAYLPDVPRSALVTVLCIYHNTLLNELQKQLTQ